MGRDVRSPCSRKGGCEKTTLGNAKVLRYQGGSRVSTIFLYGQLKEVELDVVEPHQRKKKNTPEDLKKGQTP